MNRHQRKVIWMARAIVCALPLAYLLLLVTLLVARPKSAVVTFPLMIGLMAAGTTELNSAGSLQLDKTGAVRVADGATDKCCCPCAACGGCAEGPCSATMVFSGVTICGCNTNGVDSNNSTGTLNGTWDSVVNVTGFQCHFTSADTGLRTDFYTGTTCSAGFSADTGPTNIVVKRTSNTNWDVQAASGANYFLSTTNTVASGDCTASFTAVNQLVSGCAYGNPRGINGSAVVTLHYT